MEALTQALFAIGRAFWWSEWMERHDSRRATAAPAPATMPAYSGARPRSEREALAYRVQAGI